MNSMSTFYFWILLECNMVIFIMLCFYSFSSFFKLELFDVSLYYFILQSMGSLIFLSFNCFSNYFFVSGNIGILILSIAFKAALFPFSFWMFMCICSLNSTSLFFLLTLQKLPLYFFLFSLGGDYLVILLWFSLVFGSYSLFFSSSSFLLLFCSSLYSCFWIYLIYLLGALPFLHFFFIYSFSVYLYCKFSEFSSNFLSSDLSLFFLFFLFFLGLPPLSFFFFKFYSFNLFFSLFSLFSFFILWVFVFFSLFGYLKFIYMGFFPSFSLYSFSNLRLNFIFFLFFSFLMLPFSFL